MPILLWGIFFPVALLAFLFSWPYFHLHGPATQDITEVQSAQNHPSFLTAVLPEALLHLFSSAMPTCKTKKKTNQKIKTTSPSKFHFNLGCYYVILLLMDSVFVKPFMLYLPYFCCEIVCLYNVRICFFIFLFCERIYLNQQWPFFTLKHIVCEPKLENWK